MTSSATWNTILRRSSSTKHRPTG